MTCQAQVYRMYGLCCRKATTSSSSSNSSHHAAARCRPTTRAAHPLQQTQVSTTAAQ
jgi:hypothetical protein